jgi:hypothetical protein
LADSQLARLGELEQREKNRKHLPRLGVIDNEVAPPRRSAHGKNLTDHGDCSINVERAWNYAVHLRTFRGAKNPIDGAEELADRR